MGEQQAPARQPDSRSGFNRNTTAWLQPFLYRFLNGSLKAHSGEAWNPASGSAMGRQCPPAPIHSRRAGMTDLAGQRLLEPCSQHRSGQVRALPWPTRTWRSATPPSVWASHDSVHTDVLGSAGRWSPSWQSSPSLAFL